MGSETISARGTAISERLKTDILTLFQNSISQSVSILAIVSHPHRLPNGF